MISVKSHTAEWINHLRDEYIGKDPIIIEKMINTLTLVECLAKSSLDFVFKGGTSLMLLLPKSQRFSIDVDIILPEIPKDIEGEFKEMIEGTIFDRFEEDVRSNPKGIPKSHYKFFFSSAVGNYEPNPYILLDILSTDIPYPIVNEFPIKSDIIDQDGKYTNVRIPSINSILGDKLTAFAPTTIGIPYGVEKELEINKQLFDLGVLIDHCDDIKEVSISFKNNANAELIFRKPKNMTLENVFDDIF